MKRVDISGMNGEYENACQHMLQDALGFFANRDADTLIEQYKQEQKRKKEYVDMWSKRNFNPFKEYEANYPTGEFEREIDNLWSKYDPTGAMHGTTLSHFFYIKKNGYEKWIEYGRGKNGLIEWDEHPVKRLTPEEAFEEGKAVGKKSKQL